MPPEVILYIALAVGGATGSLISVASYKPSRASKSYVRILSGIGFAVTCGGLTASLLGLGPRGEDGHPNLDVLLPVGLGYGIVGWYFCVMIQKVWEKIMLSDDPLMELARLLRFVKSRGDSEEFKKKEGK